MLAIVSIQKIMFVNAFTIEEDDRHDPVVRRVARLDQNPDAVAQFRSRNLAIQRVAWEDTARDKNSSGGIQYYRYDPAYWIDTNAHYSCIQFRRCER